MAKIYTKTGDLGQTSLRGGERMSKAERPLEAIGSIDELNAWVGLVCDQLPKERERQVLSEVQNQLFGIGALLADTQNRASDSLNIKQSAIDELEQEMDRMLEGLPELKHFVLPGGHPLVSQVHLARTVCRRAERQVVRLQETQNLNPLIIAWLNRLSDYFFVLARMLCQNLGIEEIRWIPS